MEGGGGEAGGRQRPGRRFPTRPRGPSQRVHHPHHDGGTQVVTTDVEGDEATRRRRHGGSNGVPEGNSDRQVGVVYEGEGGGVGGCGGGHIRGGGW